MARPSRFLWFAPIVALAAPALILPAIWIGRSSLDREATAIHARGATASGDGLALRPHAQPHDGLLIVFLICFALHLHSAPFLGWVADVFIPAMFVFLHFHEERELEIRFGSSYMQYRASTPMFFPRLRH